nr:uncharacterized protein LOC113704502 [Coffea arabica]
MIDYEFFEEAVKDSKCQKAMDEEIAAIEQNNTWELTDLPKGQKSIDIKWEQVFVDQPPGYVKVGSEHKIGDGGKLLIVCLYVDDLIFTGNDSAMFEKFKKSIMAEFDISNLEKMHYFLGIEVVQSTVEIFVSQKNIEPEGKWIDSSLYNQIVGSLIYLTITRPDIMHAVSLISRYMESPRETHLLATKRILRYLQGTIEYGLFYKNSEKLGLFGFTDSDYAGDSNDRKSTSGYVFVMGSAAISWCSKKQPIVTLSTTKAEYVATMVCACQVIWLRNIPDNLHFQQEGATTIYCDNSSAIKLSKCPVLYGRTNHIDVWFHFLRELARDGIIDFLYCKSEDQIADIMTKPLKLSTFQKLRKLLAVCVVDKSY